MATVELRGYVSYAEVKKSAAGKPRATFTVGVKQKEKAFGDKPESVTWANYRVTQFGADSAPENKAYVTVKGYLTVREYEKDGQKRTSLDVNATEVEVAPPMDGGNATPAKDGTADEFPF